jgi:signal transduction histidine kinase
MNSVFAAATQAQAKAMVEKAVTYAKTNGNEKAYQEFNTAGSQFFAGELYIFAYDMDGTNLALGANPKMTGKNLLDMKSADGKFFLQEMIEVVKSKGEGWVEYKWTNPETKKIQDKASFVKKIPGSNSFVGCGIYK